ncbi:MAG: sigma-70 family RNA polymerase sigma factor [Anaerolineales bacterium]
MTSIDNIVQRAKDGDKEAFGILYEEYFPIVYRRARCLVPEEEVDDVVQDIFIAVWLSLPSFRGEASLGTWIRTLTNRKIVEYYRKTGRQKRILEQVQRQARISMNLEEANTEEEFLHLKEAFSRLAGRYQEVLFLRFAEGMRFEEIAFTTHQTLDAVKSLFRRAIKALGKELDHL